jgi:hypothetical protein
MILTVDENGACSGRENQLLDEKNGCILDRKTGTDAGGARENGPPDSAVFDTAVQRFYHAICGMFFLKRQM